MKLSKNEINYIINEYQEKLVNWYNDNSISFNDKDEDFYNQLEETVSKWLSEPSILDLEALKLKFDEIHLQIKKTLQ